MGTEAYTLGRGEVHFAKYKAGTQTPEGYRYLGNSPEWSLTLETQNLDHYSSDRGVREKDKSIPLEVSRSGSLVLDEIKMDNLALFLFSSTGSQSVTQASATAQTYAIPDAEPGLVYQIGETTSNPNGVSGLATTGFSVASGATTYDPVDDYIIDSERGLLTIVEGGAIVSGTDLTVTYGVRATSFNRIVSGSTKVEGALMYIENNPTGENKVWKFPNVTLAPNGDLNFKGDEWQQIPLTVEVLKKSAAVEAIYVNGLPV